MPIPQFNQVKSSQVKSFKIRALWGTPAALQGPGARSLYLIDITPRSVRSNRAAFSSVLTEAGVKSSQVKSIKVGVKCLI
jgi:hypothetical protein